MLIPCLLFATSHCITRPVSCYLQKEKCRANCRYYCYFPGLNLCGYLKAQKACLLKDDKVSEFSKASTSWKTAQEQMTGNVVTPEVDCLQYVVLSNAEKHVPYGQIVGTTECMTLQPRCGTNRGRYNRIQLYMETATHRENMSDIQKIILVLRKEFHSIERHNASTL